MSTPDAQTFFIEYRNRNLARAWPNSIWSDWTKRRHGQFGLAGVEWFATRGEAQDICDDLMSKYPDVDYRVGFML